MRIAARNGSPVLGTEIGANAVSLVRPVTSTFACQLRSLPGTAETTMAPLLPSRREREPKTAARAGPLADAGSTP